MHIEATCDKDGKVVSRCECGEECDCPVCRAFFIHRKRLIKHRRIRDCPVMSGFFHALFNGDVVQLKGSEIAGYIGCDCPVMSGFFHARGEVKEGAAIEKLEKTHE